MLAAPFAVVGAIATAAIAGGTQPASPEPVPTAAPSTPVAPSEAPTGFPIVEAEFPPRVLGLRVRSVAEAIQLRQDDAIDDEVIAISGYLTVQPDPVSCFRSPPVTTLVDGVACQRDLILADTPEPVLAWQDGEIEWAAGRGTAHLHPQAFPGTSLVDAEAFAVLPPAPPSAGADGETVPIHPVPVTLLARFGDPRVADPRASGRHTDLGLVVERVVWVDGAWQDRPAVRFLAEQEDDLTVEAVREAASEAVAGGTVTLGHAILDLELLTRIDPEAAGLARRALPDGATEAPVLVWYVRVMTRDGLPVDTLAGDTVPRRIGWVVLAADGTLLAARTAVP